MTEQLTGHQRKEIFRKVVSLTTEKFADPKMNGVDWASLSASSESEIVATSDTRDFELLMNQLLQGLGTSHIGFFHSTRPRSPGRIAIAATFMRVDLEDGLRWMFQDVHPGGLADKAAIKPGDVLLKLNGLDIRPPVVPLFTLATEHEVVFRRGNAAPTCVRIAIPASQNKKRPLVVPDQVVTSRKVARGAGYIKVSMFPGMLGMDVARDISQAVKELSTDRLIVDLRGNTGGGIGCLRLMSTLCPDKRGVGYNLGRKQIEARTPKERLPIFDKIPASKWGVLPLLFKFGVSRSVALFSEGLGKASHHGKIVLLVNEHSASASEMVAAFASENALANLVGTSTPGKLVGASSFKVGHGYRLALPVGVYFTWKGSRLEGKGIAPTTMQAQSPEGLVAGIDEQLERAVGIVNA